MPERNAKRGPLFAESDVNTTDRSLITAISEIQELSIVEKMGRTLPTHMMLLDRKFAYSEVGFHAVILDGFCNLLGIPLAVGVLWGITPIFGNWDATWLEMVIAVTMGVGYGLHFSWMLGTNLGHCYYGVVCRRSIDYLHQALWVCQAIKVVLLFMVFHTLRAAITPEAIQQLWTVFWPALHPIMSDASAVMIQDWMLQMREVFIVSSWLALAVTVIGLTIPSLYCAVGHIRATEEHRKNILYDRY
jgi:hypothetical protein